MLKEKYNLLCLYPQIGGIYAIGLYKRCASYKNKNEN